MRFALIGAGAIGGVTAAYMTLAGEDVTVVCRRKEAVERLCTRGMRITGVRGERYVPLNAVLTADGLEGSYDCVIVATKAYDTIPAVRSALPYLAPDGVVVVMQNGVCVEELAEAAGAGRAAMCVVSFSSTMKESCWMEITGEGGFVVGMVSGGADQRLERVRAALEHAAPAAVSENIMGDIFAKLIVNSGITCGGALTGQKLGRMLASARARRFFIALVYEDMALAEKMGIKVPPFGGKLDYYSFIKGNSVFDSLRRHLILGFVGLRYRNLKSSSLTSLERGQNTEVDVLNGWISRKAAEYGVPVPVNDRVVAVIKEIEAGERAISPDNLRQHRI